MAIERRLHDLQHRPGTVGNRHGRQHERFEPGFADADRDIMWQIGERMAERLTCMPFRIEPVLDLQRHEPLAQDRNFLGRLA